MNILILLYVVTGVYALIKFVMKTKNNREAIEAARDKCMRAPEESVAAAFRLIAGMYFFVAIVRVILMFLIGSYFAAVIFGYGWLIFVIFSACLVLAAGSTIVLAEDAITGARDILQNKNKDIEISNKLNLTVWVYVISKFIFLTIVFLAGAL